MSPVYPGNIKLARQQLKLADEIRQRAYELDPTLRKPSMSRQSFATNPRRHAFDGEGGGPTMSELRAAHGKLSDAVDSLGKLFGKDTFPFAEARDHCKAAADHAGAIHELLGGEDSGSDIDLVDPVAAAAATEEKRDRLAEEARDGVGESPARSVSNLKDGGADPDHRKDFNSTKQGGADAAMGFDLAALLQRDPDSPRARGEAFAACVESRGKVKTRARNAKQSPQHAQDADSVALDLNELFQNDR